MVYLACNEIDLSKQKFLFKYVGTRQVIQILSNDIVIATPLRLRLSGDEYACVVI